MSYQLFLDREVATWGWVYTLKIISLSLGITSCFLVRFVPTEGFFFIKALGELCYND